MIPHLASLNQCTGCSACSDTCRHNAITMRYNKNGFLTPTINYDKCIGCKACERACPILNIDKLPFNSIKKAQHLAAWSNNDEVCLNSSSGGIFSQIAINLLRKGNFVVFGSMASKGNTCKHRSIKHIEELNVIAGTKYIQSNTEGSYKEVRKALQEGMKVFYCGTPCQIAGLYAFLGYKNLPSLYTAELICHGIASNITADITTTYIGANYIESFRDKKEGWCKPPLNRACQQQVTYKMKDGSLYRDKARLFTKAFVSTHRISCTSCLFAQPNRIADLSLGDLWGLYNKYPQRGDLGASLVLANNNKGLELLNTGSITTYQHKLEELNCYTLFYPGACKYTQLSNILFLIKKLPSRTAYNIISLNWRNNPFLLPLCILNYFFNRKHHKKNNKRN